MRILSGVKPTGRPHLGNYFGAIQQFVDLQHRGEGYFFVADLHALDEIRDREKLLGLSNGVALDYLAFGLDPKRAVVFRQSDVPEVSELQWILGTVTPFALLQRGHAYKDALAKSENVDFGLFAYPVLMAADILLYLADGVPVGKDQTQHIEFTRDIATKFNQTYCPDFDPHTGLGGVLKLPDGIYLENTAVVPGTDGEKMSKSYGNTIEPFADDKTLKKQVMRIVTDSTPLEAPKNPDTCNVYALLKLFCEPAELAGVREQYLAGGVGYGHFKTLLLDKIHEKFDGMREVRLRLEKDPAALEDILADGARRARETGGELLAAVKRACGVSR
ncbi:MAG: tryptophan--tRNA ligase [Candidatus Eisenbacteria bacterium]|uniref:Tryptophan--tRNA ligase n=1 Tax=Eiseniibacteriota bacterium TaxID=2212470 RepID=A0A956LXK4_UNCEI|nr:tryptophan--tRNA ligase [Candidatus Eisenbacteria bacterium]